jgi:hypothetical protein
MLCQTSLSRVSLLNLVTGRYLDPESEMENAGPFFIAIA